MAITFSKSLPTDELLSSHNNNIVEFSSNNPLTAVSCMVTVNGNVFDISPNPNGLFRFNFKDSVKTLINLNNFKDSIVPDIETNGYIYLDNTLYLEAVTSFVISFDGGTTESTTVNYNFTKSVKQPRYLANTIDKLQFLLPSNNIQSYFCTYFLGYPFDIPLWSSTAQTVTVTSRTNSMSITLDLVKGINRIFLSQGSDNFTFDDLLPLRFGTNELEFFDGTDYVTLFIDKHEADCSPYLKFYGDDGYYGYFRFNKVFKLAQQTKTIDTLESDYEDITSTFSYEEITGKSKEVQIKLMAENINEEQKDYLTPLLASPKVEMYFSDLFYKQESDSYFGVTLKDGTFKIVDSKRKLYNFELEVSYKLNTLTL